MKISFFSIRQRRIHDIVFIQLVFVLVTGLSLGCSTGESKKDRRSDISPDTLQTNDFYFFLSADAFLDSRYDVLAIFEERVDIPVLPVDDSFQIFQEKAAHFIDARDPEEFAAGHIPGAVNIPYDQMTLPPYSQAISRLDKNGRIVVYCNTHICSVSYTCAENLMYLGYNHVVIAEGYMLWAERGYPVEKSIP